MATMKTSTWTAV